MSNSRITARRCRLKKSSEHGRPSDQRLGYVIDFGGDELFLGAHGTIAVDRSGGLTNNQYEILVKQVMNHARGIITTEDDIIRVIGTKSTIVGPAILSKSRYDSEFLDGQWNNGEMHALSTFVPRLMSKRKPTTGRRRV